MLAYSLVDSSGSYLANVILKSGRNEVQFYALDAGLPSESPVKRHELHAHHSIICACWITEGNHKPAPQKRKADSQAAVGEATPMPLLVVSLALKEVWVFSPISEKAMHTIHSGSQMVSVTGSLHSGHFWGLDDSGTLAEFSAVEGKVVRQMQASIKPAPKVALTQILHTQHRVRKNGAEDTLLLAAHDLYIIDGTKAKKNVQATIQVGQGEVSSVSEVAGLKAVVGTASGVWCVDLVRPEAPPVHIGSKLQGSTLRRLEDYFVAYTDHGAELYRLTSDSLEQAAQEERPVVRVACIKTASPSVRFENLFSRESGVFGVWYHGLQPRFVKISDSASFSGNYEIPIETGRPEGGAEHNGVHEKLQSPGVDISFRAHTSEIHNLQPAELFESLSSELLAQNRPESVLALCSSNDDENAIKETIRNFSKSDKCSVMVENLFDIISSKVAADPTHKLSLSVWLRWVLLTHGGYISKQASMAKRLKTLQQSLDAGMALIPKLLGLQGRLQLLKAQAEYRSRVSVEGDEEADRDEREFEALNDTLNNTSIMEDSTMYLAENDGSDAELQAAPFAFEDGEAA